MGLAEEPESIGERFAREMGNYFETYGASSICGRILGRLIFSTRPLSLDEIAQDLQISKPAASVNVRVLSQMSMVEKVTVPGDRRDFYRMHPDCDRVMLIGAIQKLQGMTEILERAARALSERVSRGTPAAEEASVVLERLEQFAALYRVFQRMAMELAQSGMNEARSMKPESEV
ncbi:MAG: hypothetical protein NUW23_01305 [Firmicutes bacterium]|jgi:DNA-binding transcriptional regulator GbsR (MarR family)|nr:hypothetical protein [Bacillota bacterium]